jgi:hypothetical protein
MARKGSLLAAARRAKKRSPALYAAQGFSQGYQTGLAQAMERMSQQEDSRLTSLENFRNEIIDIGKEEIEGPTKKIEFVTEVRNMSFEDLKKYVKSDDFKNLTKKAPETQSYEDTFKVVNEQSKGTDKESVVDQIELDVAQNVITKDEALIKLNEIKEFKTILTADDVIRNIKDALPGIINEDIRNDLTRTTIGLRNGTIKPGEGQQVFANLTNIKNPNFGKQSTNQKIDKLLETKALDEKYKNELTKLKFSSFYDNNVVLEDAFTDLKEQFKGKEVAQIQEQEMDRVATEDEIKDLPDLPEGRKYMVSPRGTIKILGDIRNITLKNVMIGTEEKVIYSKPNNQGVPTYYYVKDDTPVSKEDLSQIKTIDPLKLLIAEALREVIDENK